MLKVTQFRMQGILVISTKELAIIMMGPFRQEGMLVLLLMVSPIGQIQIIGCKDRMLVADGIMAHMPLTLITKMHPVIIIFGGQEEVGL